MDGSNINQQQSFFDLSNLNSLRQEALQGDPDKKALKQVAAQFESIFTQMLFKSMRKANEAFEDENSPFNASSVKFYRDMHDQQMSMELSQSGALGLADIIVEQLSPTSGKYTPASLLTSSEIMPQQRAMPQQKATLSSSSLESEPSAVMKASALSEAKNEPKADPSFTDENSFVQGLWQHAKQAAEKIGLNPAVMLAQAALETGWGKHVINKGDGQSSNNFFNIKADKSWQGDKAAKVSLEFEQGVAVKKQSQFRVYENVAESFDDFIDFLQQNPRYQGALNTTQEPQKFLTELQQAGYATDPDYADKIINVLKRNEFSQAVKSVASELDIKQMINHSINSVGGIK